MAQMKILDCKLSDGFTLERVRYFPRMLLTPDDMNTEQEYFRDKLRRHNRLLHGWGVVCGCEVQPVIKEDRSENGSYEPWLVKIMRGYILGPFGDEIIVNQEVTFDVRKEVHGTVEDGIDPWCRDVKKSGLGGKTIYIAIKYQEYDTRPVRAHPLGCNCDEVRCEHSRIREGFVIKTLMDLPSSHEDLDGDSTDFLTRFKSKLDTVQKIDWLTRPIYTRREELPSCPQCPEEPWVILADIKLDDKGNIEDIDCCKHRRLVKSLIDDWWQCYEPQPTEEPPLASRYTMNYKPSSVVEAEPKKSVAPIIKDVAPKLLEQGEESEMIIKGNHFVKESKVDFGEPRDRGITKKGEKFIKENELKVMIKVWKNAQIGPRDVTVINPGSFPVTKKGIFKVVKKSK